MDDAGFDLYSPVDAEIKAHDSVIINTGVHVKIPAGCAGLIVAKSGLNTKHDLTATGLIDRGYTGSIRVKLYNNGDHDYSISDGDKITQLVIVKVWMPKYDKDATDPKVKELIDLWEVSYPIAKVQGVPAYVVNGKYLLMTKNIMSLDSMVNKIKELSAK